MTSTSAKPFGITALVLGLLGGVLCLVGAVAGINYLSTFLILGGAGLLLLAVFTLIALGTALFARMRQP